MEFIWPGEAKGTRNPGLYRYWIICQLPEGIGQQDKADGGVGDRGSGGANGEDAAQREDWKCQRKWEMGPREGAW